MARSTLSIRFVGASGRFPLDINLGPRQKIAKIFRAGESYDITDICSPDELNRSAEFAQLVSDGVFTITRVPGTDVELSEAISVAAETVNVTDLAEVDSNHMGSMVVLRKAYTSGGSSGTPDDVTIFAATCPMGLRVVDAFTVVTTAVGASTLSVRTATAGGGTLLVAALSSGAAGLARSAGTSPTATSLVASGGSIYIRRSDRSVVGELFLVCVKESA